MVARALRDAGMEVVYTGLHQTPEQIVETAIQEDADAVGLSVLSGAHMTLFRRVIELLAERGADDIVVFGGGIIPEADIPELQQARRREDLHPGRDHAVDRRLGTRQRRAQPVGVISVTSANTRHKGEAGRTPHTSGLSMHDAPPPPLDRQGIGRLRRLRLAQRADI